MRYGRKRCRKSRNTKALSYRKKDKKQRFSKSLKISKKKKELEKIKIY